MNKKIPAIHFAGFTEDWEEKKLGEIVERVRSYSLSRDVETEEDTGYRYIHYGDIHTKVANMVDWSSKLPIIKAGKYELLQKGDLVLADASEDYKGIATPSVVIIDPPYKLVSGLHTIALRPKHSDSLFFYYLFNSTSFKRYGYRVGTGMKVFGISINNLIKFMGYYPTLPEQTRIGNFFKTLDDTIALHEQEVEKLKETKAGFLQKMFPAEGETTPALRFAGFTGDWEEKNITEISTVFIGLVTTMTEHYQDSGVLLIRNSDIKNNCFVFDDNPIHLSEEFAHANNSRRLIYGDVVTVHTGDIGTSAVVTKNEEGAIGFATINTRPNHNVLNSHYLSVYFNTQPHKNYAMKVSTGDGRSNYNLKDFNKLIVPFPTLEEQTRIGNFFQSLDNLITLKQKELDGVKKTKQAFLQKMFI